MNILKSAFIANVKLMVNGKILLYNLAYRYNK